MYDTSLYYYNTCNILQKILQGDRGPRGGIGNPGIPGPQVTLKL